MTKLKLCPFWGREPALVSNSLCRCDNADCMMYEEEYSHFIKEWNICPIEDALRKQLETSYKTLQEARAESENLYKQLEKERAVLKLDLEMLEKSTVNFEDILNWYNQIKQALAEIEAISETQSPKSVTQTD